MGDHFGVSTADITTGDCYVTEIDEERKLWDEINNPEFLKRCRKLMGEETLLIVSLALCFGMVVMAAHTGFSAAFGAFIMGSILAEINRGGIP